MKNPRRTYGLLTVLIVLFAAVATLTLRAAAQSVTTVPLPAATAPAAAAPAAPAPVPPATQEPAPAAPASPATEPGATRDKATVAPDKKESADNNVSFPVDI
jgi:hypothetical protein